jgi:prepilin-type N-terminal cleavage/methylation domain-containing protein
MQRSSHNFGFTLMELVLVLVVIAICAAIAAPNLRGFAHGRTLPNTATALMTTARWCRVQALSDGVEYRLNLDSSAGRWWVTRDDGTGTNFTAVSDDLGREFTLPEGLTISDISFQSQITAYDAGVFISFRPGGRTDVAKITLSSDNFTLSVSCDTPLGSYHVDPGGAS